MTGDTRIVKDPAQAGTRSSLGAPKPAYEPNDETPAGAAGPVDGAVPGTAADTDGVAPAATAMATVMATVQSQERDNDGAGAVVGLDHWLPKPDMAAPSARLTDGLVTVRAKPVKRKNAKERAKAAFADKTGSDQPGLLLGESPVSGIVAAGSVATDTVESVANAVTDEAGASAMAYPKPEKRKNAKARALEKLARGGTVEDGTTPDMTATAKSELSAPAKAEATKAEATKAEANKVEAAGSEAIETEIAKSETVKSEAAKSAKEKAAGKKAGGAKVSAKKAPARKAEVQKAAAGKADAKKSEAKKSEAKKAPVKKAKAK